MTQYYVYHLINSIDGQPFYIGKGTGSRMYQHIREAERTTYTHRPVHNKIRSIISKGGEVEYKKFECLTEDEAFAEEKRYIALFGRRDLGLGPLMNLSDGGEGAQRNRDSVERTAAKHRGMKRSDESKENMRQAQHKLSVEHKQKYGGKGHSPETCALMSKQRTGTKWSENARSVIRVKPTAKSVLVFYKNTGTYVGEWESMALCAKELSLDVSAIWKILSGRLSKAPDGTMRPYKSTKGYTFKYKE